MKGQLLASTLSLLICSLYVGQPAQAMDSICPPTSAGFSLKQNYAGDPQTMMNAVGATLKALSIPMVSTQNQEVTTDKLQVPIVGSPDSKGQVTSTRIRFKIAAGQRNGQTRVSILTTIDTASAPAGTLPTDWHDVTLFHAPTAVACNHWLYEALDNTLNGRPPTQTAQEQLAHLGGATPASATPIAGVQSKSQTGAASKFDGGLGSSGDIGGGGKQNSAAPSPAGNH
jgi:hypothetical protein